MTWSDINMSQKLYNICDSGNGLANVHYLVNIVARKIVSEKVYSFSDKANPVLLAVFD